MCKGILSISPNRVKLLGAKSPEATGIGRKSLNSLSAQFSLRDWTRSAWTVNLSRVLS